MNELAPDAQDKRIVLALNAFFLAMNFNQKTEQLDKAGVLYEGHKIFRIGFRVWDRYNRRMIAVRAGEKGLLTPEIEKIAILYAEAADLVERLGEYRLACGASEIFDMVERLSPIIERTRRRRARRLHALILATRMPR